MAAPTVVARPAPPGGAPPPAPAPTLPRVWPRRLLIGLNIFVAICLLGAGTLYGYVSFRFGQIHRVSIASLFHGNPDKGGSDSSSPGDPLNILVVGSDTRTGLTQPGDSRFGSGAVVAGARSDTIMVVHLDPATKSASLLSIPRDLWVPISGKGYRQRINTAFDTGPDLLVRTIQEDLNIPINHFVEVDFDTFRQVVNALGGVKFWYPEPVRDNNNGVNDSGLNITTPGCYTLNGDMALSLVRTRHLMYYDDGSWHFEQQSDLARIRRQQLFVKRVIHKAESSGLADVTKINGVVGGIVDNLTVDSGFSQSTMLRLAKTYHNFNPDHMSTVTLPTHPTVIAGNDVLLLDKAGAQGVIDTWDGQSAPAAPAAPVALVDPSTLAVGVLNGTGRTGEAGAAAAALRGAGFQASISGTGRADSYGYATTTIRYSSDDLAAAQTLQSALVGAAVLTPDPSLSPGSLILVTGDTYAGAHAPGAATPVPTTVPSAAPASQAAFPGSHGQDPPPPGSGC